MLVSLHAMGTAPNRLPLRRLEKYLTRKYAGLCEFTVGTAVPSVGEPEQDGSFYTDGQFVGRLPQWPHSSNMAIIFTEVPIEDNYFARSVRNVSIITTFEAAKALEGSEFRIWDYLVLKCIQELFWVSCKINCGNEDLPHLLADGGLFHYDRPGCLFNFSNQKLHEQAEKLRWATIETDCAERARVAFSVPDALIRRSQNVLNKLTCPTFLRSFTKLMAIASLNFVYGAVIGGLLTNLLITLLTVNQTPAAVWYVFITLASAAVGVPGGWHIRELRHHRKRHKQR